MIVDIFVLAVLLISALISFLRGVIREILTIAGVIGGTAAAYFGGPLLSPFMRDWVGSYAPASTDTAEAGEKAAEEAPKLFDVLPYDVVADVLAYGIVFIVVVAALSILSHFLAEGAKSLGLGPVDRTLGFVFGLIRGALLVGILYLPVYFFVTDEDTKEAWFSASKTHFYVEKTSAAIASFIPQSAVDEAGKNIEKVSEADKTRKKLEEINLLRSKDGSTPSQDMMKKPIAPPATDNKSGYTPEFRQQMDTLFEEGKTEAVKPAVPPAAPASAPITAVPAKPPQEEQE